MRIAYISSERANDYYQEVATVLEQFGEMTHYESARDCSLNNFDMVFVEFIGENAIIASHDTSPKTLIIRTHGVEVYEANLNAVRWENVDVFGVLTNHQFQFFNEQRLQSRPKRWAVLPLPAMVKQFQPKSSNYTKDVGLIGHITGRKGHDQIPLFLKEYPEYHVHVLGKTCLYGGPVWEFAKWNVHRMGMDGHLHYQKHLSHDEVPGWFQSKSYVWLPSIEEAQSRVLMEGMLCGLTPIIRRWAGAEELWPPENIYDDISDIGRILEMPPDPDRYRKWILDRFGFNVVKEIYGKELFN
jgi:hypothetical protein